MGVTSSTGEGGGEIPEAPGSPGPRSPEILSHLAGFRNFPIVRPTIIDVVRPATLSKPGSGEHKVVQVVCVH